MIIKPVKLVLCALISGVMFCGSAGFAMAAENGAQEESAPNSYATPQELRDAAAKVSREFKEGVNYKILPGKALSDHKLVTEFFSFYCGHCHAFLPMIRQVRDALPDDVEFTQNPVHYLGGSMGPELQKAYAAAVNLNVAEAFVTKVDDEVFNQNKVPQSHDDVVRIFEELGVPAHTFEAQYKSFPVSTMAAQYRQNTEDSKIQGVPAVVVNGKYIIIARGTNGIAEYYALVKHLLELDDNKKTDGGEAPAAAGKDGK